MNFTELCETVSVQNEIDPRLAKKVCQSVFDIIADELHEGNSVVISKFGTFEVCVRDARVGYNPQTKQKLDIPAKNYPKFKPSKYLKDNIN